MKVLTAYAGWWQWFGAIVASIVSLVLILVVFSHVRPTHVEIDPKPTLDSTVKANIKQAPIPEFAKEDILELATSIPTVRLQAPSAKSSAGLDDRLLRKFDEL